MNTVLITGAAKGIGRALTEVHLALHDIVIMVDKDAAQLAAELDSLSLRFPNQVRTITCDVTCQASVAALALQLGQEGVSIDYLYNNAGIIGELAPVWSLRVDGLRQVMDVNVYGMLHLIQACMPLLCATETPSHVVNISSLYGLCTSSYLGAYSMSKHAVLALSEALYFDLKQQNNLVHVAVAFPSFTDTALLTSNSSSSLQEALQPLLVHARPAAEVAQYIVQAVKQKQFYILPDKEVKGYCEERLQAILQGTEPHRHSVEKVVGALIARATS
jgi:short-subunit dehydrogenase